MGEKGGKGEKRREEREKVGGQLKAGEIIEGGEGRKKEDGGEGGKKEEEGRGGKEECGEGRKKE